MKKIFLDRPYENKVFIFMSHRFEGCPQLINDNKLKAFEQIINAIALNNIENFTTSLLAIAKATNLYQRYSEKSDTVALIDDICCKLSDVGVSLKRSEFAIAHNRSYKSTKNFKNYKEKQDYIDLTFYTDYLLDFNGKAVTYKDSFYALIAESAYQRINNNCSVSKDSLVNDFILPKFEDMFVDSKHLIKIQVEKFLKSHHKESFEKTNK